jgi:diacylglycerol kinase (ATP)
MAILLFHNPGAGDRDLDRGALRSLLSDAGDKPRYVSLDDDDWKDELRRDADRLVVAGGDGAVRRVLLAQLEAGDARPVTILPIGTANNIARTLGLFAHDLRIGPDRGRGHGTDAANAEAVPFDIGEVRVGERGAQFVEAFGGGLFAELIAKADELEDEPSLPGNALDRALTLLRHLLTDASAARWHIQLDGEDRSGTYLGVEIMNTRFAGPNVALAPEADPGDGMLEVVLLTPDDVDGLLGYVNDRLAFNEAALPTLELHRGRAVHIQAPEGALLHLDDEVWDPDDVSRLDVGLLPGAVRISLPSDS